VNPTVLSILTVSLAYLVGAIPFGYLIVRWLKGVDVRTVGSGNIGATNAARVLGFRFFWVIFALDLAKGLLPTWGFPRGVAALTGQPGTPDLPVLVAMATIVGHSFPVYLGFKGGKGVATSIGAMLALDVVAIAAAAGGFVLSFAVWQYVSLSSLIGAVVLAVVHFARVNEPWSREQLAMSLAIMALVVLLFARHRKNIARIIAGTEPKVPLRKKDREKRDDPPKGRIAVSWLAGLAVAVALVMAAAALWQKGVRRDVLEFGRYSFREVARAATGHQRAERVAFADGGTILAVTCPRYNRLVLYRVTANDTLTPLRDIELAGKPVAVCPTRDRLIVLERPPGDDRHVKPGWWETFDLRGEPIGPLVGVGFYPDDLALSPDGRHAYVLTSGRAEGSEQRPAPALDVFELGQESAPARPVGRVTFDDKGDDPARLTLSLSGHCAAVTLLGSNTMAAVELSDPTNPRLIGRSALAQAEHSYLSRFQDDRIVMPVASGSDAVMLPLAVYGQCVVSTLPHGSGLAVDWASTGRTLGRLTLHGGRLGLSEVRPTGLASTPGRGLIAVATRAGGVHLIAVRAGSESIAVRTAR
jgi:acyl-phosphate glycerol 3-phosphate acyltransferase